MLFQVFKEQFPFMETQGEAFFLLGLRQFLVDTVTRAFDYPPVMLTGIIPDGTERNQDIDLA